MHRICFSFWLLSKPTGLVYHQPQRGCISSVRRTVYHHASACISCRLDDIQCFALVIYKDSVFDDIHGFAVIRMREVQLPPPKKCSRLCRLLFLLNDVFHRGNDRCTSFVILPSAVMCPAGREETHHIIVKKESSKEHFSTVS